MANTKYESIVEMLFLKLSNANVSFGKKTFIWKTYITNKTLSIIKQIQIIDKKNFVETVLNVNSEIFVVHVVIQEQEEMPIHFKRQVQIKAQVRALLLNKGPTKVLAEYSDYSNIFLAEYVAKLLENTRINEHIIELEEDKQPPFGDFKDLYQN